MWIGEWIADRIMRRKMKEFGGSLKKGALSRLISGTVVVSMAELDASIQICTHWQCANLFHWSLCVTGWHQQFATPVTNLKFYPVFTRSLHAFQTQFMRTLQFFRPALPTVHYSIDVVTITSHHINLCLRPLKYNLLQYLTLHVCSRGYCTLASYRSLGCQTPVHTRWYCNSTTDFIDQVHGVRVALGCKTFPPVMVHYIVVLYNCTLSNKYCTIAKFTQLLVLQCSHSRSHYYSPIIRFFISFPIRPSYLILCVLPQLFYLRVRCLCAN